MREVGWKWIETPCRVFPFSGLGFLSFFLFLFSFFLFSSSAFCLLLLGLSACLFPCPSVCLFPSLSISLSVSVCLLLCPCLPAYLSFLACLPLFP